MTLTEAAYYTRRTINWGILSIFFYFILRIGWAIFVAIMLFLFPPKGPPPNHRFGQLPAVKFPQSKNTQKNLAFVLETIQGSVPEASDSAVVYLIKKEPPNILALPRTKDFAEDLLLDTNEIQITKNVYKFEDTDLLLRYLTFDIVTDNFTLQYDFDRDTGLFLDKAPPSPARAKKDSHDILEKYHLDNIDFDVDDPKITYLKLVGNELIPILSYQEANAIRADYFRLPIQGLPVVYPYPSEGPIYMIFSGSDIDKKKLLKFNYTYWQVDLSNNGTYEIKKSADAWEELKSGKGYIARYPSRGSTATIRNVYLAYYDTYESQLFMQPVFVFEGDDDFLGYVPAIVPEWIQN